MFLSDGFVKTPVALVALSRSVSASTSNVGGVVTEGPDLVAMPVCTTLPVARDAGPRSPGEPWLTTRPAAEEERRARPWWGDNRAIVLGSRGKPAFVDTAWDWTATEGWHMMHGNGSYGG